MSCEKPEPKFQALKEASEHRVVEGSKDASEARDPHHLPDSQLTK
jgi:hypothetical protein